MKFLRDRKAQGAFEYILLLAGVLLIVVLAIIILRGSVLTTANAQIQNQINAIGTENNLTIAACRPYLVGAIPGGASTTFIANASNPNSSAHCFNAGVFWPDRFG